MWLAASAALLALLVPCAAGVLAARHDSGPAFLQMAGVLGVLGVLAAARGFGESHLYGVAVVLALASGVGTLLYAHFLERWR